MNEKITPDALEFLAPFKDLNVAREHAHWAFDVTIDNILDKGGSTQHKDDKYLSRRQQQARLRRLSTALNQLSDDQYSALNEEIRMLGSEVPSFKTILNAIDKMMNKLKGKAGRSDLKPFHAAAPYLLQYLELNGRSVTTTIHETSDGTVYSDAIEFLNREFQLLANDENDRKRAAKSVIEAWRISTNRTPSN